MEKPFVYEKLKKDIIREIRNEKLKSGNRILSINELTKKYGISTKSVIKAIGELKVENILSAHQGKGTFVAGKENNGMPASKTIGVIAPDLLISFHTEIVVAIEKEAYENGFHVVIGNVAQNFEKEESYMKDFSSRGFDGAIVITGMNSPRNKYFPEFIKHMPVVVVDAAIKGVQTDFVTTDDISGAHEAVCHLINLGHRKIAVLAGPPDFSTARLKGYKNALLENSIPFDRNLVKSTDFTEESSYRAMLEFLKMKKRPTAFFGVSDIVALGAIKAIHDYGLKIPDDISVVGYGCLKLENNVSLTTVIQPASEMGKIAFRNLLEKIEGKRNITDIKEVILPTKLLVRKSSGRCNSTSAGGPHYLSPPCFLPLSR